MKQINKINYAKPWNSQESSFDVELSFTWLDWRIVELVLSSEVDIEIEDMDEE